ncbi:MAG: ribonuclease HII [Euryarchaeota archaeon]|jgi:ribonuclease HII|nr:ribonuclease HII [Euryarchaeota archaeon]
MWLAGIDEAGRGPCIGPLVVAIVAIPHSDLHLLDEQGIDDSKKMTYHQRLDSYNWLQQQAKERGWVIQSFSAAPGQIDNWMESHSLNELEVEMFANLANKMQDDIKSHGNDSTKSSDSNENSILHLDACDVNEQRFGDNIATRLDSWPWKNWEILSEHGADANYKIVGAASIIAKHERDLEIDKLKEKSGLDIGSGYPSDPKTIAVLPKLVSGSEPHEMLRWAWKTTERSWQEIHDGNIPIRPHQTPLFKKKNLFDF